MSTAGDVSTAAPTYDPRRLLGMVISLAGVVVLAAAWISAHGTGTFVQRSLQADGTVISLEAGRLRPTVQFVAAPGNTVIFVAGGWSVHDVGDTVKVRFLEVDARGTAELDEVGSLWPNAVALSAVGLPLVLAGLGVMLRPRRS